MATARPSAPPRAKYRLGQRVRQSAWGPAAERSRPYWVTGAFHCELMGWLYEAAAADGTRVSGGEDCFAPWRA
jgi:hypothetical protein